MLLGYRDIRLAEVEAELARRFGISGLDEKAARVALSTATRGAVALMNNLRIGVPSKGRLAEVAADLLKSAGLSFRRQERSLFARCREVPVDVTFLRTDDIPVLCDEGAIDMGITGGDLVAESGAKLASRLDLGVGECRLAVCVPDDSPITTPSPTRRTPHRHQLSARHRDVSRKGTRPQRTW